MKSRDTTLNPSKARRKKQKRRAGEVSSQHAGFVRRLDKWFSVGSYETIHHYTVGRRITITENKGHAVGNAGALVVLDF